MKRKIFITIISIIVIATVTIAIMTVLKSAQPVKKDTKNIIVNLYVPPQNSVSN